MNWLSISKYPNAFAFSAGIAIGFGNWDPPIQLPAWRFLALFMATGVLIFPFMIYALLRLHVLIKSGIELIPLQRDRCFISTSRPLDTLLFAAHFSFWQGLGVLVTFWLCWPHNLILGMAMMFGYYSILAGIRLTLSYAASKQMHAT